MCFLSKIKISNSTRNMSSIFVQTSSLYSQRFFSSLKREKFNKIIPSNTKKDSYNIKCLCNYGNFSKLTNAITIFVGFNIAWIIVKI